MAVHIPSLKGDLRIRDMLAIGRFNKQFKGLHPYYFKPDGIVIFTGPQGSGKTLSAVKYVRNILQAFPNCKVISNIKLTGIDTYEFIGFVESLDKYPSNGEYGVIFLIDEIQTEFSSLESKNISPSELAAISQQRKRRIHIVGTAQLWTRVAKPFREQTCAAIDCDSILGGRIQRNRMIDFNRCAYDLQGNLTALAYSRQFWWTRSPEDYTAYDTTAVIKRFKDREEDKKRDRLVHADAS